MEVLNIEDITYKDIIGVDTNILSLDISVNSTGWVRAKKGVITYGTYKLVAKNMRERRQEFKRFLLDIIGDTQFDLVIIEDVIAGNNFKTTQALIQLNVIIEDMMYDGMIKEAEVCRVGNTVWKGYLRRVGVKDLDIKCMKVKDEIREHVNFFGFNADVPQDIYDAMGMIIGVITHRKSINIESLDNKDEYIESEALKYKVRKFKDEDSAIKFANKIATKNSVKVKILMDNDIKVNLREEIKSIVEKDKTHYIFVANASIYKLGFMALEKGVESEDYIVLRESCMKVR